tara:strand:- start:408 stop:782 length:375 start_codon:yes stop_codon:yes gene_type:complete
MNYQAKTKDKKSEAIQYGPKTPARISLRRSKFWKPEKKADGTDKNAKFYGYATDKDGTLYKLSMWDNEENSVLDKVFASNQNYSITLSGSLECMFVKCEGKKPDKVSVPQPSQDNDDPYTNDKF